MGWGEAIKAALVAIPKFIDLISDLIAAVREISIEQNAARIFNQRVKEFELAKEKARNEADTSELNRLIRNPPKF